MQAFVTGLLPVWVRVGDIFSLRCPCYLVTAPVKLVQKFIAGAAASHGTVYHVNKLKFPAFAAHGGVVFLCPNTLDLLAFWLWLADIEPIFHAQRVGHLPNFRNGFGGLVELSTGLKADAVDDEMVMDIFLVNMSTDKNFIILVPLRQLEGDFMRRFRRQRIPGIEGLHHVVVEAVAVLAIEQLGIHHFRIGRFRRAVHAADQHSVVPEAFVLAGTVSENVFEPGPVLHFRAVDKIHGGYSDHLLRSSTSDRARLTAACRSVSSARLTVCMRPMFANTVS